MLREKKKNGFDRLVFEAGDGVLRRWSQCMEDWRLVQPERRNLPHPRMWYLDEARLSRRPVFGIYSLGIFAERLLWEAYRTSGGDVTREVVAARRFYLAVRKRMAQMRYRGSRGRIQKRSDVMYLKSSVSYLVGLAARANARVVAAMEAEKAVEKLRKAAKTNVEEEP